MRKEYQEIQLVKDDHVDLMLNIVIGPFDGFCMIRCMRFLPREKMRNCSHGELIEGF
jgi:hypothetical protein